jgi:hypothetical protein
LAICDQKATREKKQSKSAPFTEATQQTFSTVHKMSTALPPTQNVKLYKQKGEELWKQTEKVNSELFVLTYGSLVYQLMKDLDEDQEVNKALEKIGYNIGCRLIEDFLAKTQLPKCPDLRDTAEIISKLGFKMFLNITPTVSNWSQDGKEFSLLFDENPQTEFVDWPPIPMKGRTSSGADIWYSNVICGVLRGALEMVQLEMEVRFVACQLKGAEQSEIKLTLLRVLEDEAPTPDE